MKHQKTTAHSGCTCFQVTTKTLFIQSSVFSMAAAETNHRCHHGDVDILLSSWSFEIRRVWDQNMMSDRGAHPLPEVVAEGHSGSRAGFRFQTRKPSCVYMTNVSTNINKHVTLGLSIYFWHCKCLYTKNPDYCSVGCWDTLHFNFIVSSTALHLSHTTVQES